MNSSTWNKSSFCGGGGGGSVCEWSIVTRCFSAKKQFFTPRNLLGLRKRRLFCLHVNVKQKSDEFTLKIHFCILLWEIPFLYRCSRECITTRGVTTGVFWPLSQSLERQTRCGTLATWVSNPGPFCVACSFPVVHILFTCESDWRGAFCELCQSGALGRLKPAKTKIDYWIHSSIRGFWSSWKAISGLRSPSLMSSWFLECFYWKQKCAVLGII